MRTTLIASLPIIVALQLGCGSQIETHISWSSCSLIEGKSDGLAECATVPLPPDDSQAHMSSYVEIGGTGGPQGLGGATVIAGTTFYPL